MYYCHVVEKVCTKQDPGKNRPCRKLLCTSQSHISTSCKQIQPVFLVDCGEKKSRPGAVTPGRPAGYFDRRLESAEAARDLVVLLDLRLFIAFDALEATFRDVRTEFFAK